MKADLRRDCRPAHEFRPPLDAFGGKLAAQSSGHVLARPTLDALFLELLNAGGNLCVYTRAKRRRRTYDGESTHAGGPSRGKGAGDGPADLRPDEMKPVDLERVHETDVVVDDDVESPGKVARHGRRRAETAHIGTHDAIRPRKRGHPAVPGEAALGIAVQQQYRLGLAPGIGVVVHHVVHFQIGWNAQGRHHVSSFASIVAWKAWTQAHVYYSVS